MKIPIKIILLTAFCVSFNLVNGQLYNNGGILTVQNGALIKTLGDFKNNSGTIVNDGKIEVQGNFINTGSYSSTLNEDSLLLTGSGIDTLTVGTATINFLTINKTSSSDIIRLGGNLILNKKLDYTSGVLETDPILNPLYLISSPVAAVYNFTAGQEIVGSVKRTGWINGGTNVFNQQNMLITTNGGTAPSDVTVTMLPQSGGGNPSQNERELTRSFKFLQTGGSGFTADIRYPYLTGELNTNTESRLVPWKLVSSEWNGLTTGATRDLSAHFVNFVGIPATDFVQEWKLADPKYTFNVAANLRGSWNGTLMSTSLNSGGLIPLAQPYNVTPFNYAGTESVASIPNANVVDWVLVEDRKPITGLPVDAASSTITGRKAGFLLNTGVVTELDGVTPIAFDIAKQGLSCIAVRHRNHLGVLSNAIPSNAVGTFTNDYSVLANSYYASGAASSPVVLLSGATGKYGLWSGDANKNGVVNITDINIIKSGISTLASGYLFTDTNLSNSLNITDVNLTKATISALGTGSNPARQSAGAIIKTNLPDPIIE